MPQSSGKTARAESTKETRTGSEEPRGVTHAGLRKGPRRQAVEFELTDQFKQPHAFTLPRKKVTVLIFGDRKSAYDAEPWGNALWDRYKERISSEGVGVGSKWILLPERPAIRFLIRKATDYPIMLDWKGKIGKLYNYHRKQINVFVVEPNGSIVYRICGPATQDRVQKVFKVLDRLLEETNTE